MDRWAGVATSYAKAEIPASGKVQLLPANSRRQMLSIFTDSPTGNICYLSRIADSTSNPDEVKQQQQWTLGGSNSNAGLVQTFQDYGSAIQEELWCQGSPGDTVETAEVSLDCPFNEYMPPAFQGKNQGFRYYTYIRSPAMPPMQLLPSNPNRWGIVFRIGQQFPEPGEINFGQGKLHHSILSYGGGVNGTARWSEFGDMIQDSVWVGGSNATQGGFIELFVT